jgi:hypothetical protein
MDCPTETRIFNPGQGKLNERTTSCHFIGYHPKKSKGFRFYYSGRQAKFIEIRHAIFLEEEMIKGSKVL